MAAELELTLPQIYKYEQGIDRMSAGRLHQLARLLHVPIRYFFQDYQMQDSCDPQSPAMEELRTLATFAESIEGRELCAAFVRIMQPRTKRLVIELIETLGDEPTVRPKRRM
jgi:transcriptional regulator with XRE-family HTH domain